MYDQKVSRENPLLLIIAIDQSASMDDVIFSDNTRSYSSADIAKYMCDVFLYESFRTCNAGNEIRPYIDFALVGYGSSIRSALPKVKLEEFPISVTRLSSTWIKKNDSSNQDDSNFPLPKYEWVESVASGSTSMHSALSKIYEITESWIKDHPNSFPPVIINITDGMPTDDVELIERLNYGSFGDLGTLSLVKTSKNIDSLSTKNGHVLMCNAHISNEQVTKILYPSSTNSIENGFAELLFEMSSYIPDELLPVAQEFGLKVNSGSKLFIFNSDVNSLLDFFKFGTTGSLRRALGSSDNNSELPDNSGT